MNQKEKQELIKQHPLLETLIRKEPVFWQNPLLDFQASLKVANNGINMIEDAARRFERFRAFFSAAYTEYEKLDGKVESPLVMLPYMQKALEEESGQRLLGKLLLKRDDQLPVAGSIKARGGFHEVCKIAEELAFKHGLLRDEKDDYSKLLTEDARSLFSQYSIAVGSTGNLGLSIGILSRKFGFNVSVHMSADAKYWKKELLRNEGAVVKEYNTDFSKALESGRIRCQSETNCYFIDDENSVSLFAGYSVAALQVKEELAQMDIHIDDDHPLFVYLPCGVGGGPGGVTFGLKHVFGKAVHCFFAEPTHSPSMLVGVMTRKHSDVSVQDFGIDNKTEADGLAVGRPSAFVGKRMEPLLSGVFTVEDDELFRKLSMLYQTENKFLEPSALAGMNGPILVEQSDYLAKHGLQNKRNAISHLVWGTGGSLVPTEIVNQLIEKGNLLNAKKTKR
ncbi:D-serine dehydratase [Halalkalibacter wakoensis JCM 9140]|uniref:Probable D-serine dehydratase n=1 Tax=Halalkalibacter wakoensis JCM 9140 TaxID=1236970 RepID=W4Q0L7_9BACI|nr:D-serine ammonia-lyase [Halalkalibacter wakoensis]GAE25626.1 D-serine dehydratase [Halalkalibacter wakoensis JCM 9140]